MNSRTAALFFAAVAPWMGTTAWTDASSQIELLLPGGMLYSVSSRTYRSLHLPSGSTVQAGAYSPDSTALALLVVSVSAAPVSKSQAHVVLGPINKLMRRWRPSTHLIVLDRRTGEVRRSWALPGDRPGATWTLTWPNAETLVATAQPSDRAGDFTALRFSVDAAQDLAPTRTRVAPREATLAETDSCPATLAAATLQGKNIRFTREAAACSTPPEPNDVYSLLRDHPPARPEILWQYRVAASTSACVEPYACYTGNAAHFLSSGDQFFLAWDADLYRVNVDGDETRVTLLTQWLPQYNHPWGLASGDTSLNALDVENKEPYQAANPQLILPHSDSPQLYAQNFCPTKSFNATVTIGAYKKSVEVPAGNQVGPIPIDSFSDAGDGKSSDTLRAYTPLLVSLSWTSFHHISDPVSCSSPYTWTPNTNGIILSIGEHENGTLRCDIQFQENR